MKKAKKKFKVGDDIYVPTSLYLSHGEDDFHGGLCKIIGIGEEHGWKWVRVKERPTTKYGYDGLIEEQKKLKKES